MSGNRNQNTEKSILEAAERLFLEKGFALTTTIMIAKEVGCNQSLVHYYYRSKENLFELVFQKALNTFIDGFTDIDNKGLIFEERLKYCVYTQFEILQSNPNLAFFLINELNSSSKIFLAVKEQFKRLYSNVSQFFGTELQFEIINGNIKPISIDDLLLYIFSMNAGTFLFYTLTKKLSICNDVQLKELIASRKEESFRIILSSILTRKSQC